MHNSGQSLYELKSGMQKFPQVLINVKTEKKINPDQCEPIQKAVKAVEQKLGSEGRVLLRASGTEPLIRVMVEGRYEDTVNACANDLADTVRNSIQA
jgi:phosphoglucosamine mutase